MIWLQTEEQNGNALYLDIHRVEQRQQGGRVCFSVAGMLGNGRDEGEVLVEIGTGSEVTFVDEWLPGQRVPAFVFDVGRETVTGALIEAVAEMLFCVENFPSREARPRRKVTGFRADGRWMALRPRHYAEQMELPIGVKETSPEWRRSVA
jgi:hypothetical protein